jgi:hypothetical protein
VTSAKKVEPTDQTGETIPIMTITNPKIQTNDASLMPSMMTLDGIEIESNYEEIEFDDESSVDYDMDYTVQE